MIILCSRTKGENLLQFLFTIETPFRIGFLVTSHSTQPRNLVGAGFVRFYYAIRAIGDRNRIGAVKLRSKVHDRGAQTTTYLCFTIRLGDGPFPVKGVGL